MFIELTNSQSKKFLINTSYILEIVEDTRSSANTITNAVIITPFREERGQEKYYEVQETVDEIKLKIKEIEKK